MLEIYRLVHEEGSLKFQYDITESTFCVKDYIKFINREDVKREVKEFKKKKRRHKRKFLYLRR